MTASKNTKSNQSINSAADSEISRASSRSSRPDSAASSRRSSRRQSLKSGLNQGSTSAKALKLRKEKEVIEQSTNILGHRNSTGPITMDEFQMAIHTRSSVKSQALHKGLSEVEKAKMTPAELLEYEKSVLAQQQAKVYPVLIKVGTMQPYEIYGFEEVLNKRKFMLSLIGDKDTEVYVVPKLELARVTSKFLLEKIRDLTFRQIPSDELLLSSMKREERWGIYKRRMCSHIEGVHAAKHYKYKANPKDAKKSILDEADPGVKQVQRSRLLEFSELTHVDMLHYCDLTSAKMRDIQRVDLGDHSDKRKVTLIKNKELGIVTEVSAMETEVLADPAASSYLNVSWHIAKNLRMMYDLAEDEKHVLENEDFNKVFAGYKCSNLVKVDNTYISVEEVKKQKRQEKIHAREIRAHEREKKRQELLEFERRLRREREEKEKEDEDKSSKKHITFSEEVNEGRSNTKGSNLSEDIDKKVSSASKAGLKKQNSKNNIKTRYRKT